MATGTMSLSLTPKHNLIPSLITAYLGSFPPHRNHRARSIFSPATTSTAASMRRIVSGVSRRLPNSAPNTPPISAAGAHPYIPD